ncbi:MAG TPA: hypothetical protein VFX01_08935 [Methylophilaceae bacterium]|nr:hypothetical protein [Methylophilaceae bacterium]
MWEWFIKLNNTRSSGMGISGISYQEIKAFCELHGIRMSLFELNAINQLDRIALTATKESE